MLSPVNYYAQLLDIRLYSRTEEKINALRRSSQLNKKYKAFSPLKPSWFLEDTHWANLESQSFSPEFIVTILYSLKISQLQNWKKILDHRRLNQTKEKYKCQKCLTGTSWQQNMTSKWFFLLQDLEGFGSRDVKPFFQLDIESSQVLKWILNEDFQVGSFIILAWLVFWICVFKVQKTSFLGKFILENRFKKIFPLWKFKKWWQNL